MIRQLGFSEMSERFVSGYDIVIAQAKSVMTRMSLIFFYTKSGCAAHPLVLYVDQILVNSKPTKPRADH
jgi:hypothetical protein